jgi:hypothetical protein
VELPFRPGNGDKLDEMLDAFALLSPAATSRVSSAPTRVSSNGCRSHSARV